MFRTTLWLKTTAALALLTVTFLLSAAHAQTETVLYSFQGGTDAALPYAGVAIDKKGNLYGTTYEGGANGTGAVYKVTASGAESVLYSFGTQAGDGVYPLGGVILDKKGNLYGMTYLGGTYGLGTVYKVTPSGTETVLYTFGSQPGDGANPIWDSGLALDKKGNLYGTTYNGGAYGYGTAFKLAPNGTETVLHSFSCGTQSSDGCYPEGAVALDKKGNLYGITLYSSGGAATGTVWKITPAGAETVLFDFGAVGALGAYPFGGVVLDKKGNVYGTTNYGGTSNAGIAFKITPSGTETVLYNFGSSSGDGLYPTGVVLDKLGDLYGTCQEGGTTGAGTVYKLTPSGTETVLYTFATQSGDGYQPWSAPVLDTHGNLYGTTLYGGANTYGTVFKVTP